MWFNLDAAVQRLCKERDMPDGTDGKDSGEPRAL